MMDHVLSYLLDEIYVSFFTVYTLFRHKSKSNTSLEKGDLMWKSSFSDFIHNAMKLTIFLVASQWIMVSSFSSTPPVTSPSTSSSSSSSSSALAKTTEKWKEGGPVEVLVEKTFPGIHPLQAKDAWMSYAWSEGGGLLGVAVLNEKDDETNDVKRRLLPVWMEETIQMSSKDDKVIQTANLEIEEFIRYTVTHMGLLSSEIEESHQNMHFGGMNMFNIALFIYGV